MFTSSYEATMPTEDDKETADIEAQRTIHTHSKIEMVSTEEATRRHLALKEAARKRDKE